MRLPARSALQGLLLLAALLGAGTARAAAAELALPLKQEPVVNEGLGAPPPGVDRSTPRRAWSAFVEGCRSERFDLAMHVLNLGDVPRADRPELGPRLARQLCEVLASAGLLTAEGLDDTASGPRAGGGPANMVRVASLEVGGRAEEIWLRRTRETSSDATFWLATRQTVSLVPSWHRARVLREASSRLPLEELNRGLDPLPADVDVTSPRAAATTFRELWSRGDYLRAAGLMDLSGLPAELQRARGERLARRLGLLLDRAGAAPGLLSNDPLGAPEREVPIDEELVARISGEEAEVPLRLARYPGARGGGWLFSGETTARVDPLYQASGYGWAGDHLPPVFFKARMWGLQLWQWIGLLLLLPVSFALAAALALFLRAAVARAAAFTAWTWDDAAAAVLRGPLHALLWAPVFLAGLPLLAPTPALRAASGRAAQLVALLGAGWLAVRLVDVAGDALTRIFSGRHDALAQSMVPVFRRLLKPLVGLVALVFALQNVGMNVGGLLAGLGIGGLAVALAGKNTLENLFGSVAIAFDRPFKIGDFVKVGEFTGTIEDVGLRSTRIRTLDRTLVTIPNSQMADSKVENFAARDRMRLLAELGVQYDTTLDQLRLVVDDIKRYLLAHPHVWQESFSVRFIGFGESALRVEVVCYVTTADWGLFTGIREAILMDLAGIVERAGVQFAFPSQTLYMAKERPADDVRPGEASAQVRQRADAGELCLPEIPEAVRRKLARNPTQS